MSDAAPTFVRPPKAGHHCRHYSYVHADLIADCGPRCAIGKLGEGPGAAMSCMPEPRACCDFRAEHTEAERQAWNAWIESRMTRIGLAIAALPAPIQMNSSGTAVCPNCGGRLHFSRWHRGASIACETENCCEARLSIQAGADWPSRQVEPMP